MINLIRRKSKFVNLIFILIIIFLFYILFFRHKKSSDPDVSFDAIYDNSTSQLKFGSVNSLSPLIFIGGWPRSGTTLMRVILDVNDDVRCGPESRVIPRILEFYRELMTQKTIFIKKAITPESLDAATAAFILEVIRRNGLPAKRLCNKDPMSFLFLSHLGKLFPNAKFILMVRDGRAVVHSVYKRRILIQNVDHNDPWKILKSWNLGGHQMLNACHEIGSNRCLVVKYENLVLQTDYWINYISGFLQIPRDPKMFKHSKFLNNTKIVINENERSTDQVIKPIRKDSLLEWAHDKILPQTFLLRAHLKAPLLKTLGYDISRIPPAYE